MNDDGNGTLTLFELERCLADDMVRAHLLNLGIGIRDVTSFFDLITEVSGRDSLAVEEFGQRTFIGLRVVANCFFYHLGC